MYVMLTYMGDVASEDSGGQLAMLRQRLVEAEEEYRRARAEEHVVRLVRDATIVDAHRGGMSSREISALVGDIGQPNVVRTRRRAVTRTRGPAELAAVIDDAIADRRLLEPRGLSSSGCGDPLDRLWWS